MELEFQIRSGQVDNTSITGWENSRNDFKKYASENKSTYTPTTNIVGTVSSLTSSACLDLSKYFDTLNHELLMNMLRKDIHDKELIELIKRYLKR